MTQIKEIIELLENMTKHRDGLKKGEKIVYVMTDKMPQVLRDMVLEDPFKIMDCYYNLFDTWTSDLIDRIDYKFKDKDQDIEEYSELNEVIEELSNELESDVYTSDLTAWLHSSNYHVYYLDNAQGDSGFNKLSDAQYNWKYEMYNHFNRLLEYIIDNDITLNGYAVRNV